MHIFGSFLQHFSDFFAHRKQNRLTARPDGGSTAGSFHFASWHRQLCRVTTKKFCWATVKRWNCVCMCLCAYILYYNRVIRRDTTAVLFMCAAVWRLIFVVCQQVLWLQLLSSIRYKTPHAWSLEHYRTDETKNCQDLWRKQRSNGKMFSDASVHSIIKHIFPLRQSNSDRFRNYIINASGAQRKIAARTVKHVRIYVNVENLWR